MLEPIPDDLAGLLSRPVLWPEEVERVRRLALQHGLALRIERRDLDDWQAGWRQVESVGGKARER